MNNLQDNQYWATADRIDSERLEVLTTAKVENSLSYAKSNCRLQEMNVSLWGKAVAQFLIEHKMHRQKNVVLIATVNPVLKLNEGNARAAASVVVALGVDVAAGVEAVVVTVEKRDEVAVSNPTEAGCVTAAVAVETVLEVGAGDTKLPKLMANAENPVFANEKLPEDAAGV
ncbi:hypothetical protein AgCh_019597 [Apium graveolens]